MKTLPKKHPFKRYEKITKQLIETSDNPEVLCRFLLSLAVSIQLDSLGHQKTVAWISTETNRFLRHLKEGNLI